MREMLGRVLGHRYKIIEKIGEGGMARVYRGIDMKLNRPVAIKVLYEHFVNDPEFIRRFQQEAKAAARLSHPAIVNVYDEGEEEEIHYIVMEYVNGETLKEKIVREKRLKPEEAINIALQICDALVHAHAQNVIHRDIKPQNIIITPEGRVKVADFGIAKAAADSTITHGRSLLGSVYYSSPEQARGSCADQKSDIYSLGVVIYEMLTGTVPFSGESPISIALKHMQEEIVPPRKIVPGIPGELDMIIIKAMHKDRNMRYQSALELLNDLEEWLKGSKKEIYNDGCLAKRLQPYKPLRKYHNYDLNRVNHSGNSMSSEEDNDEEQEERKGSRWSIKRAIFYFSALAGIILLIWFGYQYISGFLIVPEVTVPELTGLTLEEAEEKLASLGLEYSIGGEVHSDTIPEGSVVSQKPPAGRSVRKERVIELVLSLGPEYIKVPNLLGRTELEARLILSDLGLNMEISHEYSEEVAAGYVLRQDPGEGFRLGRDETVYVVISGGKKPFSLRNLQGWDFSDAKEWLNLYGLVLRNVEEEYSDQFPEGQVISQFPPAGEMVQSGDPVDLVISKGRKPGTYKTYDLIVRPQVPLGQVIKVYIEDENGMRIVFEGEFLGEAITTQGVGSGKIILMELRDNEYITIDTRYFP